ncbi:asparagine synthase-related protein [Methylobacter sp. YRD-M1]|uniref:asparagine synthase-related protein n=1 Tax=Methylobacter sp. YRD-M1 TaxID=2911520 RepID=UPI00227B80EF|nr:asparagine synthetase B family protein [Methylobacter sp. YRD-M1]WAK01137.1 asparagine synthase-related protein [Methylobacter sp. YRD-M1]
MPGVVGYFDPQGQLPENTLRLMRTALAPALTEDSIMLSEAWGGIAVANFNKLPAFINKDNLSLALLGEIEEQDNDDKYRALLDSDSQALSKLHGSFIAVRFNKTQKQLSLIIDRFGSYPCYVAKYKNATLFATQIKSILKVLPSASLDQQSIAMMLSIGEVIGNRTMVNEVTTLPAASITCFKPEGNATQSIYWHYLHEQKPSANREKLIDETGYALTESVKLATQAHPHASIPLSGGLDSRFILGLANQQHVDIDAYTWGTPDCRDLRYARQVTQITKTPHHTYNFDPSYLQSLANQGVWLTEGNIPAVHFHVLPFINEVNSSGSSVLLDGFAGDATLGGNFIGKSWLSNPDLDDAGQHLWHWRLSAFSPASLHTGLASYHQIAKDEFTNLYKEYAGEDSMDKGMSFLLDNRVRRITTCGTEIFRSKVMVKQPFMNIDVINVTRQIPHQWRIRHRFYLDVMRKFTPDVAQAFWQRTCLPASSPYWLTLSSLAFQKALVKSGPFSKLLAGKSPSQFDAWFRGSLKSYTEEILLSETTIDRGVLPINVLKEAWNLHQQQKIDASNFIGSALTIELFSRLFMDDLDASISKYSN